MLLEMTSALIKSSLFLQGHSARIARFLINELEPLYAGGTNIRELLVDNGINVYRSITRWTNCKGKQRCGTCIVDVRVQLSFLLNYQANRIPIN